MIRSAIACGTLIAQLVVQVSREPPAEADPGMAV